MSNFNFGATVVLNTDPTTFVQNYYYFLTNVSNSVGQQVNTITVTNIQYGSATVNFVVSTANTAGSSGASTQQSNLQNILNSQTIGGMTVTKSTLVVNGAPSTDTSSSNSNTILIIAIVVPIAALSTYCFI